MSAPTAAGQPDPPRRGAVNAAALSPPSPGLDAELKGRLPCVGCSYDLQGLTIRGQCPECGLAIRATILFRVDPHAEAFKPLRRPRVTAAGIVLWTGGATAGVLLAWAPRIADIADRVFGFTVSLAHLGPWTIAAAAASALGAIALVDPGAGTPKRARAGAIIGALAYIPLGFLLAHLYLRLDPTRPAPYFVAEPQPDRVAVRLAVGAVLAVILLGLRPNARRLAARSVVLRTGRVDRQTIAATIAALCVAAIGDAVRLASLAVPTSQSGWVAGAGSLLVLVGSLLTSLAIFGALADSIRIRRAILMPSPSLRQITHPPADA